MHVHFEQNNSTRTECTLHSLSWMGKVPESLPENDGGWKLNRHQYYMEGWLASGNGKGVVGVTFTTSHCKKYEPPQRSNFNLRGHRSEVSEMYGRTGWYKLYMEGWLASGNGKGVVGVTFTTSHCKKYEPPQRSNFNLRGHRSEVSEMDGRTDETV